MSIEILTDRERDVVSCVLHGRSIKKTALLLKISPKTVETYLRNLMLKLQCHSRDHLIDVLTESNMLAAIQRHYASIIGHEIQENSLSRTPNNKSVTRLRILVFLGVALLCSLLIVYLIKDPKPYLRDHLLLPPQAVFLERLTFLEEINKKFSKDNGIQTVVLVGVGGAGKTTIAHHYASQYAQGLVWEIHTNTKENILLSFEKLMMALMHQDKDKAGLQILKKAQSTPQYETILLLQLQEKLSKNPGWLLIFDDVHNLSKIQKYLPHDDRVWGKGKIIITTRNFTFSHIDPDRVLKVDEMTELEKLKLFNKIIHLTGATLEKRKAFLTAIPPFPLDVSTAAHYLKTAAISYQEYLGRMQNDSEQFSGVQTNILQEIGNYTKTRYSIIGLSIKKLLEEHKDFGDLLLLLSLVDTQNVPRELLNHYKDSMVVDIFFHALQKHSLLTNNHSLNLHKTTQTIIRNYLTQMMGMDNQQRKLEFMSESIEKYTDKLLVNQDLQALQSTLPHLLAFLKHEKLISEITKANISVKIASINIQRQLNQQRSLTLLMKSLDIYKSYYPTSHPRVAWVLGQIGILKKFHPEEQKVFFQESLKTYANYYRTEHPIEGAWVLVHFGNLYRRLGQYDKAKDYLEKSLKIYEAHYGEQNIQTAWVLANLGRFYRHMGDQKKAKALLEKCLMIHHNHPIKNEIENAWVTINLGIVYYNMENFEKSKVFIDRGVQVYVKHYNAKDYELCWALIHQALTDGSISKDWSEAEVIITKNAAIFTKKWGENHEVTAWALERLMRIAIHGGNYLKAQYLLRKISAIYEKRFGHDSIQVAFCKNYLGYINFLQENYPLADRLFQKAFEILYLKNHPRIYLVLENLVNSYKAQGIGKQRNLFELWHYEYLLKKTTTEYLPSKRFYLHKLYPELFLTR